MFSDRIAKIGSPVSLALAKEAKKLKQIGVDIIDLSIGQPDVLVHENIINGAYAAMLKGYTGYTESQGILPLRELVCNRLFHKHNLEYNPNEIIITPGAKQAIYYTLATLLNEGDEVIIIEPCWLSYRDMVLLSGGVPVIVETCARNRFLPVISDIESKISQKTKLVIINNPANPTGVLLEVDFLRQLAELCVKRNLLVLTDDIYDELVYDNLSIYSIATFDGMRERTIIVNGFSKTYSMTGFRIGYIAAKRKVIEQLVKAHEQIATCASSIAQYGAIEALKLPVAYVNEVRQLFQDRRDKILGVCKDRNLSVIRPSGTFYCLLDISFIDQNSVRASEIILNNCNVATVPGSAYGRSGEGFVRISLSQPIDILTEGINRISAI